VKTSGVGLLRPRSPDAIKSALLRRNGVKLDRTSHLRRNFPTKENLSAMKLLLWGGGIALALTGTAKQEELLSELYHAFALLAGTVGISHPAEEVEAFPL